jgi:WbqC-like protein family
MHQSSVLLSITYIGPAQYFTKFILYDEIWLETQENYTRQTYRNRCIICGANGKLSLTVPVITSGKHKTLIKDVRIDNTKNWQKLHWKSIESAYRSSPFYEFFIDDFQPFFSTRFEFLFDMNMEILMKIFHILEINPKISLTERFLFPGKTGVADLRDSIHPKKSYRSDKSFKPLEYKQVFSERHGFLANLSIIDLIFNTGPEASGILRRCNKPLEVFKNLQGL